MEIEVGTGACLRRERKNEMEKSSAVRGRLRWKRVLALLVTAGILGGLLASCTSKPKVEDKVLEDTSYFTATPLDMSAYEPTDENTTMSVSGITGGEKGVAIILNFVTYPDNGGGGVNPMPFVGTDDIAVDNTNVVIGGTDGGAVVIDGDGAEIDIGTLPDGDYDFLSYEMKHLLLILDTKGEIVKEVDLKDVLVPDSYLMNVFMDMEGTIRLVIQLPIDYDSGMAWSNGEMAIRKIDFDGTISDEETKIALNSIPGENSYQGLHQVIVDGNGYAYGIGYESSDESYNGFVACFDENGKELFRVKDEQMNSGDSWGFGQHMFIFDSQAYVVGHQYAKEEYTEFCAPILRDEKKLGEKQKLNAELSYASSLQSGAEGPVFSNSYGVFTYNLQKNESMPILQWKDQDLEITSDTAINAFPLSDSSIFLGLETYSFTSNYSGAQRSWYFLNRAERNPNAGKTLIRIALMYNYETALQKAVYEFNKSSQDYRVELDDISARVGNGNYEEVIKTLNAEILAGSMPDALVMSPSELSFSLYASKGLLADLYPLMEKEAEFNRDKFYENILSQMETDGKLHYMPTGFMMNSWAGKTAEVGDVRGWTLEEFEKFADGLPQNVRPFATVTRSELLVGQMYSAMNDFVNEREKTASFNTQAFLDILNFSKKYGIPDSQADNIYEYDRDLFKNGDIALVNAYLWSAADYTNLWNLIDDPLSFVGYPSSRRAGPAVIAQRVFAISASTPHQEQVWDVLKLLISEKIQDDSVTSWSSSGFPIRKSSMEKAIDLEVNPPAEGSGGGSIVRSYTYAANSTSMAYFPGMNMPQPLSEEGAEVFLSLISSLDSIANYNADIMEIIQEEAKPFLEDQKSAEDVAAIIQNRVQTKLNET